MCAKRLATASAALVAMTVTLTAPAAPAGADPDLQIHGFLSQGWVLSQGNNVNGRSDDDTGSGQFRELGVNVSWRPHSLLLFSAQTAAVEAGQAIDEEMELEYGLADITALQGPGGRVGLRLGKLKYPIGFYNDSRDAVFTRPGIIMPNSVYLETNGARSFGYFSGEGAGLYADWYAGNHAWYLEVQGSAAQDLDDRAEIAILRRPASGRFEVDQGVLARLMDEYDGGRFRLALSWLDSQLSYVPDGSLPSPTNPFTQPGHFDFQQGVLSLQYNTERFSATAEVVGRHIELTDISPLPLPMPPFNGTAKQDPVGYYVQGAYRVTPKWQWTLRYDEQIRDLQDRHGYEQAATSRQLALITGGPVQERHYYFARDLTLGTRYDVLTNVALWAEFHYVDGAGWVNPLDNPDFQSGGADRYWNFVTVMAGLRF